MPGRRPQINPQETNLLLTEPVLNLPNVQEHYDQIVFEEYDFASYLRCPGAFVFVCDTCHDLFLPSPTGECLTRSFEITHSSGTRSVRSRSKRVPKRSTTRMRARDRFRVQLHPHRPRLARPRRQPRCQEVRSLALLGDFLDANNIR